MEIPLNTPIMAHDEEITVLEFREPTTKDARSLGIPYRFDQTGTPYPVTEITGNYISRLAGIPSSSVDQLSLVDFNSLSLLVLSFFISSAETVETKLKEEIQKQQQATSE